MPDINARVHELRALENLSAGETAAHNLHPLAKILSTAVFIVAVASFGRYDFTRLAPYLFYPFVMAAIAGLPYRLLLPRMLVALPFCLFAGISNVVLDRGAAFVVGGVTVSFGVISLATILLKMYLCVMAALILVALTPFTDLTAQMRRLRIPAVFVTVFEMTFRYIGVLFEEAYSMATAYKLRSGGKAATHSSKAATYGSKAVTHGDKSATHSGTAASHGGKAATHSGKSVLMMRHMGSFIGQLILRGFDRAERVYAAMCCRGYSLRSVPPARRQFRLPDVLALAAVCIPALLLRVAAG